MEDRPIRLGFCVHGLVFMRLAGCSGMFIVITVCLGEGKNAREGPLSAGNIDAALANVHLIAECLEIGKKRSFALDELALALAALGGGPCGVLGGKLAAVVNFASAEGQGAAAVAVAFSVQVELGERHGDNGVALFFLLVLRWTDL